MKSLKIGYLYLNFHEMLADSDLNVYKNINEVHKFAMIFLRQ